MTHVSGALLSEEEGDVVSRTDDQWILGEHRSGAEEFESTGVRIGHDVMIRFAGLERAVDEHQVRGGRRGVHCSEGADERACRVSRYAHQICKRL